MKHLISVPSFRHFLKISIAIFVLPGKEEKRKNDAMLPILGAAILKIEKRNQFSY